MSGIDLRELAEGIFPSDGKDRTLALLWGYFDESGLNNQCIHTVVAGFIGPISEWVEVDARWKAELTRMGVTGFHTTECRGGRGEYQGKRDQAEDHLVRLATILGESDLDHFAAGYVGDWSEIQAEFPLVAANRFKHPYQICVELLMQDIQELCASRYSGSSVALLF
uniref:hypothetical protein n=1 Tax=Novosphingobium sp. TaxID=1874826 RepID=UPI0025D02368